MGANENTSVKCAGAMSYAENLEHERSAQAAMLRTAIERTCGYDAPLAGILRDFEKIEHADGGHARECAEIHIYLDDFTPERRGLQEVRTLREKYHRICD